MRHRFSQIQIVKRPLEEVFSFFADAKNLETITPPFLGFKILAMSTPEIEKGTIIDYSLKLHGFPMKWKTLIDTWEPNVEFVDLQLKGPYVEWHHTHRFQETERGTLVEDDVRYKIPMGKLGDLLLSRYIAKDVAKIFEFRKNKIDEIFS